MEPAVFGWREELKRYIRSIESISETALKAIKRDRIQNHSPFDGPFKEFILGLTSARIANVYMNLQYEEILDNGQNVWNQNVNHKNDGNTYANRGQQLISTGINAALIEELPIILVPPNDQQVASTSILSTTLLDQDANQTVSMPPNQLPISPVEMGINAIQELHAQGSRTGFGRDSVVGEPLAESNANTSTDTENASTVASGLLHMAMETLATGVEPSTTLDEPFGSIVNSTEQYPETVDLTSDQDETAADAGQQIADEPELNVQRLNACAKNVAKSDSKKNPRFAEKKYKCDDCEFSTAWKSNLNVHNRIHNGERRHECKVCDKRFTLKSTLIRHMKTHRDKFAFQCSNCRLGFSDEMLLRLHESRCKAKGFECHLCKRDFIDKRQLVDHMRSHSGEKLHCPNCRKQFDSNFGFALHIKTHGNLFRFQCLKCRQGFTDEILWKLHESRCKAKQFECFLCSKKFYQQKSHLLRHMRYKHTGQKPFNCPDCQKRFCEKSYLKQHSNRCH